MEPRLLKGDSAAALTVDALVSGGAETFGEAKIDFKSGVCCRGGVVGERVDGEDAPEAIEGGLACAVELRLKGRTGVSLENRPGGPGWCCFSRGLARFAKSDCTRATACCFSFESLSFRCARVFSVEVGAFVVSTFEKLGKCANGAAAFAPGGSGFGSSSPF